MRKAAHVVAPIKLMFLGLAESGEAYIFVMRSDRCPSSSCGWRLLDLKHDIMLMRIVFAAELVEE